jgi:rubrerythrin
MNIKKRIQEAQARIIENLIACESSLAELYEAYSRADSELSSFWKDIATEENNHATQLKSLLQLLERGVIFKEIGRFDDATIAPVVNLVKKELEAIRQTPSSRTHSLQMALNLETSVFDAHFYDIVKADSPEYHAVASRLQSETRTHINIIRKKIHALQEIPHTP